jgi:starvation-inducible DNA-binding protein
MNEELIRASKIAFSTEFAFYLKAANFHWNVEGKDFVQLHDLFGKIYEEVYDSIDDFAENIRKLGGYAPASFTRFSALSELEEEIEVLPPEQMVTTLLADSNSCVLIFKRVFDMAEASGEHGYSDFIAARMDAHRKHSWMLRATAKQ